MFLHYFFSQDLSENQPGERVSWLKIIMIIIIIIINAARSYDK